MLLVNSKLKLCEFLIGQDSSNQISNFVSLIGLQVLADSWLQLACGEVISLGVHILFPTYTVNVLNYVFNIDKKNSIICVISLSTVCLLLWLRWSDQIWWPIYAEIQVIPKGSHTFSCHSVYPLILEEFNLQMPHELSSTVTPHENPKYKLVFFLRCL